MPAKSAAVVITAIAHGADRASLVKNPEFNIG
jgi:hypothetical protein